MTSIQAHFEAQVELTPLATAIACKEQSVSFDALNNDANRLAHHLRDLGVGPETLVGLCIDRSPNMLVALLAVLKSGGAYVPLDPEHPEELLRKSLEDSGVLILLTESAHAESFPGLGYRVVCIDADWPGIAVEPNINPKPISTADNLAYCIYTSGTTGCPKAVLVTGKSLLNHALHMREALCIQPADRVLQFTPVTVDAALEEIFPAWLGGAAVVLAPRRLMPDRNFSSFLDAQKVSVVSLPTSAWHHWVDTEQQSGTVHPRSLRLVFVGGERVSEEKFEQWQMLPWTDDVDWMVDYGPTEATISCTTYTAKLRQEKGSIPIGSPIADVSIRVLDREFAQVPDGEAGELWIGGDALARGYLNKPALTAEAFRPNPWGAPGSRLYRSGDRGRYRLDGDLEFLGRIDRQVKVLGHRIEPRGIEAVLMQCDGVAEAVVTTHNPDDGEARLIAYVVGNALDETTIRHQLAERLPRIMMPTHVFVLDEMPRSPVSGKLDEQSLPAPSAICEKRQSRNDTASLEADVARHWTAVVGRSPSSHDADFFVEGGNSLCAIRLLDRLATTSGVTLSFSDFFRLRTVNSIASELERRLRMLGVESVNDTAEFERGPVHRLRRRPATRRPASNAQQRLWFLDRYQNGSASYSVPLCYRVRGNFPIQQLDSALTRIVASHEALRTGLTMENDRVIQEVAPPMRLRTELREANGIKAAVAIANAAAAVPFDLQTPPLLRSLCICFAPDEQLFVLNLHHAACDAWSLAIILRELSASIKNPQMQVTAHRYQYGDYVDMQQEWLNSTQARAQRAYWRDALNGDLPELRLEHGQRLDGDRSDTGKLEPLSIDVSARRGVLETAQLCGTTPFVVVLSAYCAALHRWTLQEQIVVGVPSACRASRGTEGIVGYFSNTLPLQLEFTPDLRFRDLVSQVANRLSAAMNNQELPFDEIVDSLNLENRTKTNPVFQTMFVMQDTPIEGGFVLPNAAIEEMTIHTGTAKVDLTCAIRTVGDRFVGEVEYSVDAMGQVSASRFVRAFVALIADAVRNPTRRLDELAMLSGYGRAEQIAAINADHNDYACFRPAHRYVEEQARQNPDGVAIEAGDSALCYRELDERAMRLAGHLAERGFANEDLIGICMDRSIDMIVAILAVLKAGAGFVPLDPKFPLERLHGIVNDARMRLLITQDHRRSLLADLDADLLVESDVTDDADGHRVPVAPENVAFVYYTSGTTGQPKGVVIDHRCAMMRLEWLRRRYALKHGERVVHKTPLIFDVAVWEIFLPLMAGATVLLADPQGESDVEHIGRLLAKPGTVLCHFVPSMLDAYLAAAEQRDYPDLRWVQLSGEAVTDVLVERFFSHFRAELHNCYGQTESSEVAAWEGHGGLPLLRAGIGKQIGIYRLFLLDHRMQPVPPGVPGEIHVAGAGGLARGYHGQPALTAEKFLPNPHGIQAGERLYQTGDLARINEQGVMEFLGRVDHQIKVRGCRVETAEIEAVLVRHGPVRNAAVVPSADSTNVLQLIAYVVGDGLSSENLSAHAERFLPRYMLPAAYIVIDTMPKTASGKLDRRLLPEPTASDFSLPIGSEKPRSQLEKELANLWVEILSIETVGRADNFFSVGGNSLKVIQILTRIKATFGIQISVRAFFADPTIEGLAERVEEDLISLVATMPRAEVERKLEDARP